MNVVITKNIMSNVPAVQPANPVMSAIQLVIKAAKKGIVNALVTIKFAILHMGRLV